MVGNRENIYKSRFIANHERFKPRTGNSNSYNRKQKNKSTVPNTKQLNRNTNQKQKVNANRFEHKLMK